MESKRIGILCRVPFMILVLFFISINTTVYCLKAWTQSTHTPSTPPQNTTPTAQKSISTEFALRYISDRTWYLFDLQQASQNLTPQKIRHYYKLLHQIFDHYFTHTLHEKHPDYHTMSSMQDMWQQLQLPKTLPHTMQLTQNQIPHVLIYSIDHMPSIMVDLSKLSFLLPWWQKQKQFQTKVTQHHHKNLSYWRISMERWIVVAHTRNHWLQLTWIPKSQVEQNIQHVLTPPTQSVLKQWQTLQAQWQSLYSNSQLSGWIQIQSIIPQAFRLPSELPKTIAKSFGMTDHTLSACHDEFMLLAQHIPQISFASRPSGWIQSMMHLSPVLQKFFRVLTDKLPPPIKATPDFHLSLSLNFTALLTQLDQLTTHWMSKPWQCGLLKNLNYISALTSKKLPPLWKTLLSPLQAISLHIELTHPHASHTKQGHKEIQENTQPPIEKQNKSQQTTTPSRPLKAWFHVVYPNIQVPLSLLQQHPKSPLWLKSTPLQPNHQAVAIQQAPRGWSSPYLSLSQNALMLSNAYSQVDFHTSFHNSLQTFYTTPTTKTELQHLFTLSFSQKSITKIRNKVAQIKQALQAKNTPPSTINETKNETGLSIDYISLLSTPWGLLIEQRIAKNP